tara:strand:- start:259 stop:753 length:495 start_codon:yes stop_codon:yes gene_type:complete
MKKLLLLLIIPFLSFGQICEDPNSCTYLNSYWCGNNVCAYPGDLCDNPYYFYDDDCNCSPMFLPIVCEDINACNYLDTLPLILPSDTWASDGSGYLVYDWNCNIISENACLYNEDCNEIGIDERKKIEKLTKVINLLGKKTTNNKGFQLYIYDDGSVEKKYLIK